MRMIRLQLKICTRIFAVRDRFFETFDAISDVNKERRKHVSQSLLRCKSEEEKGRRALLQCCILTLCTVKPL